MKCSITNAFPTIEKLKQYLYVDIENQSVLDLRTNQYLKQHIKSNSTRTREARASYKRVCYKLDDVKYIFRLHRLMFYWHHGYLPKLVDHKDRNSLNNNIENLRELSVGENIRNSEKTTRKKSSKYRGVYWHKYAKRWKAHISINKKNITIGYFRDEDEAGQAYNDKVRELGLEETAVLNDTPQERARRINLFNEKQEAVSY